MFRFNMRPRYRRDAQGGGDLVRYLQRQGEFAPKPSTEEKDVAYMTRQSADTEEHADLVGEPIVHNLPDWAKGDAGVYFNAARAYENRKNRGPYAMAFQIALPCALTHEQQMALAQDFVDAVMHDKIYLMVKHEPVKDGQAQPHLHILMGLRTVDGLERDAEQTFQRYNPDYVEKGGQKKDRFWSQWQAPRQARTAFVDLANYHMEVAGVEERIDPRSLRKQGIMRERISWDNPQELDAATLAKEQAKAVAAWEARKAYKGIGNVETISREEMVANVRAWTRELTPGKAIEQASPAMIQARMEAEVAALEARIARREQYASDVDQARQGHPVPPSKLIALLAGTALEESTGQGLKMKLYEKESESYGR